MIDIHSHILSGLDDGPVSFAESAELAEIYVEAGFDKVIATPHWVAGTRWMPDKSDICRKVALLNNFLKENQVDIKIFSGMEIAFDGNILQFLDEKVILPLGDKSYLLIEAPFQRFPIGWENLFNSILSRGFKVILGWYLFTCHSMPPNSHWYNPVTSGLLRARLKIFTLASWPFHP
jgi:protein-tyrosine phosphatase